MSRVTDSKSEEENHGQSSSEEERQCLVQRTPNRTAKHIQKIIYGEICSSSEEEEEEENHGQSNSEEEEERITGSAWKNFPGTAHTDGQIFQALPTQMDRHCCHYI